MCETFSFELTNITELLGTNPCFQEEHLYVFIKGDSMSGARSMHVDIPKYFFSEHLKRRFLGSSAHEYNIILKLFLRKWSGRV